MCSLEGQAVNAPRVQALPLRNTEPSEGFTFVHQAERWQPPIEGLDLLFVPSGITPCTILAGKGSDGQATANLAQLAVWKC